MDAAKKIFIYLLVSQTCSHRKWYLIKVELLVTTVKVQFYFLPIVPDQ